MIRAHTYNLHTSYWHRLEQGCKDEVNLGAQVLF